ncbi:MAG: transglutaminase-like domain-containing protein [Bacillota bacterium]|nr:transglutaminase-like domain-containing protein [Bacillota bacterium]
MYTNDLIYYGRDTDFLNFKPLFELIIPISCFAVLWLTIKGSENILLLITTTFMIVFWYIGFEVQIKHFMFYFLLLSLITYIITKYEKQVKKMINQGVSVSPQYNKVLLNAVLIAFAIVIVNCIMPKNYSGKINDLFSNKVTSVIVNGNGSDEKNLSNADVKSIVDLKNKYGFTYTGFMDNKCESKLGGSVHLDDKIALYVESDKRYYLAGSVKDYYTGNSWKESNRKYTKLKYEDNAIKDNLSKKYQVSTKIINIIPLGVHTCNYFTPELAYNVSANNVSANDISTNDTVYYDNIPTFINKTELTDRYIVSYYDCSLNKQMLDTLGNNGTGIYGNKYKQYLQLPENITYETRGLAEKITAGSKTNLEKVQKIKEYLQKNYKYSTDVPYVPDDEEFVDNFLFKQKEGYCTYFATATVILCRIVGIPARYVEGFNMANSKIVHGSYEVKNSDAHAWCEVLLMDGKNSGLWSVLDSVPSSDENNMTSETELTSSDYISHTTAQPTAASTHIPVVPKKDNVSILKSYNKIFNASTLAVIKKWTLNIAKVMLIILIIIILKAIIIKIKIKRIISNESVIPLYEYSKKRLMQIGIFKPDYTGDKEFALLIKNEYLRSNMMEIINASYDEFYGNKKNNKFDKIKFYKYIEGYIKNKQNIFKYYIMKLK